jgi:hypothetical protein
MGTKAWAAIPRQWGPEREIKVKNQLFLLLGRKHTLYNPRYASRLHVADNRSGHDIYAPNTRKPCSGWTITSILREIQSSRIFCLTRKHMESDESIAKFATRLRILGKNLWFVKPMYEIVWQAIQEFSSTTLRRTKLKHQSIKLCLQDVRVGQNSWQAR